MFVDESEIANLHAALLRARAMGFDSTAEAMQQVLEEILATGGQLGPSGRAEEKTLEEQP